MGTPGSDNYVMDPEALNKGARSLFDIREDLEDQFRKVFQTSIGLPGAGDTGEFPVLDALVNVCDEWRHYRIKRLKEHLEHSAQFLAVHAAEQVEADEFSASMFTEYVSEADFPEAAAGASDPTPTATGDPVPLEAM